VAIVNQEPGDTLVEFADTSLTGLVDVSLCEHGSRNLSFFGVVGFREVQNIAGTLFCDSNGNGIRDAGEADVFADVSVSLLRAGAPFLAPTMTDSDGDFSFQNLPTGTYSVVVSAADPMLAGAVIGPNSALVNPVSLADQDQVIDIGFALAGTTIEGYLFESLDRSSTPNNFALTGFNGIEIILKEVTAAGEVEVDRATTAANGTTNGYYAFTGKVGARYLVEAVEAQVRTAMIARKRAANPQFFRLNEFSNTSPGGEIVTFCENGSQNLCFFASVETAVKLASFEVDVDGENAQVSWSTASETRNYGFNVYRSVSINGQRVPVNADLVPASGSSTGNAYSLVDAGLEPGRYFYWLEDVDLDGKATIHGPVLAELDAAPEMKGGFDVTTTGMAKVNDAVLAEAGLSDYARIAVYADGAEIPAVVVEGEQIIFFIPADTTRIEFGLVDNPKRMDELDLNQK
jgi:hypothetical protein